VPDLVEIILKLQEVRQFVTGADQASRAIGGVGVAAEKSGKAAGISWKSVAKWGGAATAAYAAQRFIRSAVDATEDLGKTTLALNRTTGMNIQTSSEWAAVLKARNIQTTSFQRGMVTLSKQMQAASDGTGAAAKKVATLRKQYDAINQVGGKRAPAALAKLANQITAATQAGDKSRQIFSRLGVSMDALRRGDTQKVMMQVSDAFAKMRNPAERAALAQKLFARQGIQLAPILFKGSKAIRDQLALAGRYVGFNEKSAEQVKEHMQEQRELRLAYLGVQVSLGKALLPVMLAVSKVIIDMTRAFAPLIKSGWAMKAMIIALGTAFVAYKATMIIASAANVLFGVTMNAWPIFLIITGLIALGVGFVVLYKKVKWFREGVDATWKAIKIAAVAMVKAFKFVFDWVKRNWPLLVGILAGPFGLAVVLIIRHFGRIKKFVLGVLDAIRAVIQRLIRMITGIPGRVTGALKKIPGVGTALKIGGGVAGFVRRPHLQQGGTITRGGHAIVGERGPELVTLPTAARVAPLPVAAPAGGALRGTVEVRVPVFLDRRQIAEAVGHFTADKLARR
jgi:hypothetical protein